ncbi:MAG: InlB B-repeat-containing protein [Oscillospiraceae bacterium]|nr:InlB B-repeat-containing protein [Oscillospiraceae bacterium]
MKSPKKIISLLLAFILVLGHVPAAPFAYALESELPTYPEDLFPDHIVLTGEPDGWPPGEPVGFSSPVGHPITRYGQSTTATGMMMELAPGEVWTGRAVTYEWDETLNDGDGDYTGWITATLYAQARPYVHLDQQGNPKLDPDTGEPMTSLLALEADGEGYVYMVSHLGEFSFEDCIEYRGHIDGEGYYVDESEDGVLKCGEHCHYVVWRVPESMITGAEPASTTIRVWLGEKPEAGINPTEQLGRFFNSEASYAWFKPAEENGYYWTRELVSREDPRVQFLNFSINSGNNNGGYNGTLTLIDHDLQIDLMMPTQKNADRQHYLTPGVAWTAATSRYITADNRVIVRNFEYHVNWQRSGTPRIYWFTLRERNPDGTYAYIDYQVDVGGQSGNESVVVLLSRTVTSERLFQKPISSLTHHYYGSTLEWGDGTDWGVESLTNKSVSSGDPGYYEATFPVVWDQHTIVQRMMGTLSMALKPEDYEAGDLIINKSLAGYWESDWNVSPTTRFGMRLTNQAGEYLIFTSLGGGEYEYVGVTHNLEFASLVYASETTPAVLRGVPANSPEITGEGVRPLWKYQITEVHDYALADWPLELITETLHDIGGAELEALTVIARADPANRDKDPDLSGYPWPDEDGWVAVNEDESTEVTVQNTFGHGVGFLQIYKTLTGYPEEQGVISENDPESEEDDRTVFYVRVWDVQAKNYLLFDPVVRPQYEGTTTLWCVGNHIVGLTEAYTQDRPAPIMELPIRAGDRIRLANLWTWGEYEVHEVVPTDAAIRKYADPNPETGEYPAMFSPAWAAAINEMFEVEWIAVWDGIPDVDDVNDPPQDRDFGWADRWTLYDRYSDTDVPGWTTGAWMYEEWEGNWENVYEVESESNFCLDTRVNWGAVYDNNGVETLRFNDTIYTSVMNKFKYQSENVWLFKELSGHYLDWGVGPNTWFYIQLWNTPDDDEAATLLIFERERISGALGYTYYVIGHKDESDIVTYYWLEGEETGEDKYAEAYARGDIVDEVGVRPNLPQRVVGLPIDEGHNYEVKEVFRDGVNTSRISTRYYYEGGYGEERDMAVTVLNHYLTGNGTQAVVNKVFSDGYVDHLNPVGEPDFSLISRPNTWFLDGRVVDEDTVFYATMSMWYWETNDPFVRAMVQQNTTGVYKDEKGYYKDGLAGIGEWRVLAFTLNPITGEYDWNGDMGIESVEDEEAFGTFSSLPITHFPFSVNEPATLNDLGFRESYKITEYVLIDSEYVPIEDIFKIATEPSDPNGTSWVDYWVRHTINFRFPAAGAPLWTNIVPGNRNILIAAGINETIYNSFRSLQLLTQTQAIALMMAGVLDAGALDGTAPIFVYNNFRPGVAGLEVTKTVPYWPDHFETKLEDEVFYIQVYDATDNTVLLWMPDPDAPERTDMFRCVGNGTDGFSDPIELEDWDPADPYAGLNTIEIRAGQTLFLNNLWSERNYRVVEVVPNATGTGMVLATQASAGYTPTIAYALRSELKSSETRGRPAQSHQMFLINGDVAAVNLTNTYPDYYAVIYDAGGGSGAPMDGAHYPAGDTVTVAEGEPTWEGYTFEGWISDTDGTDNIYKAGDTFPMPGANVILTAQWEFVDYSVTYYAGGATGIVPVDTADYHIGDDVDVAVPTGLLYAGYRFMGWRSNLTGGPLIEPGENAFTMPAKDVTLTAEWAAEYTLAYDANNGVGAPPTDTPPNGTGYLPGEETTVQDQGDLSRYGWTFIGWNTQSDGNGTAYAARDDLTFEAADVILYAQWRHDLYTVTYAPNGGTSTEVIEDVLGPYYAKAIVDVVDETDLARDGYRFMGWISNIPGDDTLYRADDTFQMPADDVVLTAVWAELFTVTYNAGGGSGAPVDATTYIVGEGVTVLGKGFMIRAGYTFLGWTTADVAYPEDTPHFQGGDVFDMPAKSVVLTAAWEAVDYTVAYIDTQGNGAVPVDVNGYNMGDSVTVLHAEKLSYDGYRFIGWRSNMDGDDTLYRADDTFQMPADDVVLTAVWAELFTVTYDANGGSSAPVDETSYIKGEKVQVLGKGDLTRLGYEFEGWTSDMADEDKVYAGGDTFEMPDDDVILYAVWKAIDYNVTYYAGGATGDVPVDEADYHIGDNVDALAPTGLTNAGHRFMGWRSNLAGAPLIQPGEDAFQMPAGDVSLTAEWSGLYSVIYDANGGSGAPVDDANYIKGEEVQVLGEGDLTRPGYEFEGWASDMADEDKVYAGGDTFEMPDDDVILYAVWRAIDYNVTYVANNGTAASFIDPDGPYTVESGPVPVLGVDDVGFSYPGYTFLGWTTADVPYPQDATHFQAGDVCAMPIGGVVFTAQWERIGSNDPPPDEHTVTFYWNYYREDDGIYLRVTVLDGNPVAEPNTPSRDGFNFIGWFLDEAGTQRYDFSTPVTTDLDLYARWTVDISIPLTSEHYAYLIGNDRGLIAPEGNITRAEVATIFFRLITDEFRTEMWTQENPFPDVSLNQWFNNAVSTMANTGVFLGRPDGTFAPNSPITRGEFATAVSRFFDINYDGPNLFSDTTGHWAEVEIDKVGSIGWVVGIGDGSFEPDREITRAEAATLINRILERHLETIDDTLPGMITWPDHQDTEVWYYLDIQEATNSNEYEKKPDGVHKYWTALIPNRPWVNLERPDSRPEHINDVFAG